jgi:hypothetical protein
MRNIILVILLGGVAASAQSMVEAAAAAGGGSVGGVAGKKVSDGLTKIFSKVDATTAKSAKDTKNADAKTATPPTPLLLVGPGTPNSDGSAVPPPPPSHHAAMHHPAPPPPAPEPVVVAPIVPPPPPPPPDITADDLRKISVGMSRDAVLKVGEPSSRMTMYDDDHLSETFHYFSKDVSIGVIHLTDGAVSSVQVQ